MKYAQLVMGPAGSGKSTYCSVIYNHCLSIGRHVHVVNLDPAAETFNYPAAADVRALISVDDVMEDEELALGPNGALVFCMEAWDFNVCSVFLIDTHFVLEAEKFIAGALTALSAMIAIETPCVNVLTKMDLLSERNKALVLEDYSIVKFVPLNSDDEESVEQLLLVIDTTIQYGEDLEVKDRYPEEQDPEE
ncbi:hypothetical protein ANCCEY_09639 [Ancylostoma ceylanicum]|uniref:GPN-loop GTPase 3 n=1 Tax=Ancylostoma ceylanicum TaxID=53326 RepID=A0A0D6LGU9_9BILA|nr:hypothetical protein ANCCEY_09639 [Ancylostoma ceylanicum]